MRNYIIIIIVAVLFNGCSWFQSSRKIDMTPFSDNASTLFSEAMKISRPFQWKYVKEYKNVPEFREMVSMSIPLIRTLRGIVYYSNQVVAINNAKISNKEKTRQLAKYLSEVIDKAVKSEQVDSLKLDKLRANAVLTEMVKSETYMDGLAAATPVINTVVMEVQSGLNQIEDMIPVILDGLDKQIESQFATARTNFDELKTLQGQTMLETTRLYRARAGMRAELDTLLQSNAAIKEFIPKADKATLLQMAQAETYLIGQLDRINTMLNQLQDDIMVYQTKKDELTAWRIQVDEKINIARNAITIWARSHRNLASGIPVPPMIDVGGFASTLMGKAANTIIP